jgi:hypothetical protein
LSDTTRHSVRTTSKSREKSEPKLPRLSHEIADRAFTAATISPRPSATINIAHAFDIASKRRDIGLQSIALKRDIVEFSNSKKIRT